MSKSDETADQCASGRVTGDDEISFLCDPALIDVLPPPRPAGQVMPEWFRHLERTMGMPTRHGLSALTVKACLPVTDAFSLGWVIPLVTDVRITADQNWYGINTEWADDAPFRPLERHHPDQVGSPRPPFDRSMPYKWMNPWRIKVPEGYSVLFTHPLNHFELPFQSFSGFVDCDRFAAAVNFPFVWNSTLADLTVPMGTPVIQLIPMPRESLLHQFKVRASTPDESSEQELATHQKNTEESIYARKWRVPK